MATKYVSPENLEYFKGKQDEYNASKFMTKEEAPGIATTEKVGLTKPGSDFDIDENGTLTLYKAIAVNSFSCSPSQVERGSTVNDVTLSWSVNKTPTSLTLDGEPQEVGSKGKTISEANLQANKNWTLKATDARGATSQKSAGVSFLDKRHWFVGDYDSDGLTSEVLNGMTGELSTGRTKTFTVNAAAGQYVFYAFPASWGTPRFFVGGFEGGFALLKTFDHVNASGASVSYSVYRSSNAGLGNTTVEVK